MTRTAHFAPLGALFGSLFVPTSCADAAPHAFAVDISVDISVDVDDAVEIDHAVGIAVENGVENRVETAVDRPAPPSPETRAAVAVYDIDASASGRASGFFGALVTAAVTGSSLELRPDLTYVGWKDGKVESRGTWNLQDGRLTLDQTEEQGQAAPGRGTGTTQNGVLAVQTEKRGIDVTLVFHRRAN